MRKPPAKNIIYKAGKYRYSKRPVPHPKSAVLLQALKIKHKNLSKVFMEYNNMAHGSRPYLEDKKPIKPNDYMLLMFFYEPKTGHLFTSIRRWDGGKTDYTAHVGRKLNVA